MKTVVAYISAHGFGHWAQMSPVLQALHDRDPDVRIVLRTNLPRTIMDACSAFPFALVPGQVDVGMIQLDAVHEDVPATIAAVEQFHHNWDERVRQEAGLLRETGADLVLSDIAPLAFAAAAAAGIPSIGIGSIDWHAIYTPLFPRGHFSLSQIAAAHRSCGLLLALPLGMPMPTFPRQRRIALIGAKGDATRLELRRALGYADSDRVALVLFGGTKAPLFRIDALALVAGWQFMMVSESIPDGVLPANVRCAPAGRRIVDLMRAADVIVSKPGYGIISETWQAARPLVYVPRTGFPEYPHQKEWLDANAPAAELDLRAFRDGDWSNALEAAFASRRAYPSCVAGGETEAAAMIHEALADGGPAMMKG
jgi:hypothetical protein